MPSDYDKIRSDNIREYGEGTRHLSFLAGQLYTDQTHFIFELLQNAEDANATCILFQLFDDRLEVTHNGRIFDERDVRGLCGVGEGTKKDDLTQIGKFGIGFKSVYAYTATPEIYSGNESFKIGDYVRPYAIPPRVIGNSWTTLFVFPFNSDKILSACAYREISSRLRELNLRTLLFLRNINKIEYKAQKNISGNYSREETLQGSARQVSVISENNGRREKECWLIFERPVDITTEKQTTRVEIAFFVEAEDKNNKIHKNIRKIKDSPLVVYFPTAKETKLGFLIQGPYRTTPSRDNVPEQDECNKILIKETAILVRDALSVIKEFGLLSVSFLEALPLRSDDFPRGSMFYPLFEQLRDALMEEDFLPTDDETYVSAKNAKLARGADLRTLLNQAQLSQLSPSHAVVKWLNGEITQDRTPDLRSYLINMLNVEELTPDGFARKITPLFLSGQTDEWFIEFYNYLSTQNSLWAAPRWERNTGGVLRLKHILRLDNGRQETPFKPDGKTPNAFLPPQEETTLPVVKRTIVANKQARTFLEQLGLSEPNIFDDIIERTLPKYMKSHGDLISDTEHKNDILKIVRAMQSDSESGKTRVIKRASESPFLKATNTFQEECFKKPAEIYLNTPQLQQYFAHSPATLFLSNEYERLEIADDTFIKLGVSDLPRTLKKYDLENDDLEGLESFLDSIQYLDIERQKTEALVLWDFLKIHLDRDPNFFKSFKRYAIATTYNSSNATLKLLKESRWIPTKNGTLERPCDINTDQLFDVFLDAQFLIKNLEIIEGSEQHNRECVIELGVSYDDIEFLKNHQSEFKQWKADVTAHKRHPILPNKPIANPERREERLYEQLSDASNKKYELRQKSIRMTSGSIDPIIWLRNMYTNDADQMICQICKKEMPFKKRNGEYYFEKKEIFSRKYLPKEYDAQYLALCPLCAAKYNEFILTDDEVMANLKEAIINLNWHEIPILLGGQKANIFFTEPHYHDLKCAISYYVTENMV